VAGARAHDLYDILAKPAEPDDHGRGTRAGRDTPDHHTVLTASVETIDNDRASHHRRWLVTLDSPPPSQSHPDDDQMKDAGRATAGR
jgi:hypothetical protein